MARPDHSFEPTLDGGAQARRSYLRRAVLNAIRAYQRYVSPYKGFCCAYREHTGRASCSALGYRAVRRHGVFAGLAIARERTFRCGVAHRRHRLRLVPALHSQRGVCDVGCDLPCDGGCDLPSGKSFSKACDFLSCCDCGSCDWPDRKRKSRERERSVYLPPASRKRVAAEANAAHGLTEETVALPQPLSSP
jgi:uncharacterized protein